MKKRLMVAYVFAMLLCLIGLSVYVSSYQAQSLRPDEGVRNMVWNPDGTLLAVANPAGQVRVYDISGELVQSFTDHQAGNDIAPGVRALEWSPDGQFLATGGTDTLIRIYDIETGETVQTLEAFYSGVWRLAWQPTGQYLLASGFDEFQVWDTQTWQPISESYRMTVGAMEWSPDGSMFAISITPGRISTISIVSETFELETRFDTTVVYYDLDWSRDGTQIVSGDGWGDPSIRLWDAETGEEIRVLFTSEEEMVEDVIFIGEDSERVIAATDAGNVYVIDVESGERLETYRYDAWLRVVAWNPVADTFAVGGIMQPRITRDTVTPEDMMTTGFLAFQPLDTTTDDE